MQLRRIMWLLTTTGVSAIAFAGFTQRQLDVQAQPAPNVQTQPAPVGETEQRQPDVPYVPTPDKVVEDVIESIFETKMRETANLISNS